VIKCLQSKRHHASTTELKSPQVTGAWTGLTALAPSAGEDQWAAWVYKNGPLTIGIDADMYKKLDSDHWLTADVCKRGTYNADHSNLIVGFGTHPKKGHYWKIKNSWGRTWADAGYLYVARGLAKPCADILCCGGPVGCYGDCADYYTTSPSLPALPVPSPPSKGVEFVV